MKNLYCRQVITSSLGGTIKKLVLALFLVFGILQLSETKASMKISTDPPVVDLVGSSDPMILKDTLSGNIADGATVRLKRGMTYDLSSTVISKSVKIMSAPGLGGPAILDMAGSSLDITDASNLAFLEFEDVEIQGDVAAGYLMNFSTTGNIDLFKLDNVDIHDLRGVFRAKNSGTKTIGEFSINNAMIHSIGNYGVMIMDNVDAICNNVSYSNSTFTNVNQLFRWSNGTNATTPTINVSNSTLNNTPDGGDIIRVSNATGFVLNISNSILGTATATRVVNGSGVTVNATNTYATSDCALATSADFTTAPTVLAVDAASLFADPANGNLMIIDETFVGKSSVGDPRWYYMPPAIDLQGSTDPTILKTTIAGDLADGVTIILERGMTYDLTATIISKSIKIMSAPGLGAPAILDMASSSLDLADATDVGFLRFEDVEIKGDKAGGYLMNYSTTGSLGQFMLDNVDIHDLRGVFRAKNATTKTVNEFSINNSIVHNIGSYGVMIMDAVEANVVNASYTNSTFSDVYQLFRWKEAQGINSITISDCTIDNAPNGGYILRLDANTAGTPIVMNVSNTIFGSSSGDRLLSGTATINTTNSFATSDSGLGASASFTTAPTVLTVDAATLFSDPANGKLRIADGSFAGITSAGDPRWYYISTKKVAYVQKTGFASGIDASSSINDPIIRMLEADDNFIVTVIETDAAGTGLDLSGYDLIVAQETFGSGDAIWKVGGALNLRGAVPIIYNKSWSLRNGRAISSAHATINIVPDLSITVDPANQSNPLFSGITFLTDKIKLYNETADNFGGVGTNSIDVLNRLELSDKATLLASASSVTHADSAVVVNDIPQGTQIGSNVADVTGARMIAFAFNYGAIIRGDGANITSEALTLWRNAAYLLTGKTPPKDLYFNVDYILPPKEVAYVQKAGFVTVDGASTSTTDPIIKMLRDDPAFNVTIFEVASDSVGFDLSSYDLIIGQETFGSGDNIWKSTGPLGIRNISAPIIYNKTWALRNGRGISSGHAAVTATSNLAVKVDPANQTNPIFNGLTFEGDSVKLFNTTANQDGGIGTNSVDVLNRLELSTKATLLAHVDEGNDPDSTIVINYIPAGTQVGTDVADVLAHDMVAMSFNYGAMIKNKGTNLTDDGLTIWRNAAYVLTGLTPPAIPIINGFEPNDSTLADLTLDAVTVAGFDPQVFDYEILLPRGTVDIPVVEAIANNPAATVVVTNITSMPGTATVAVTAADGVAMATYSLNISVSLYPPTWTIIPSGGNIPAAFDAAAIVGDTLVLVDGGVYDFNTARTGGKQIVLMSVPNPITRPKVYSKVIEMNGDGDGIVIRGIDFEITPTTTSADYFINFTADMVNGKHVIVDDVTAKDYGRCIIRGDRSSAATHTMENIVFTDFISTRKGVNIKTGSYANFGFYGGCKVNHLELRNSTFQGGAKSFLDSQTDNVKEIIIDHCTIDAVNEAFPELVYEFVLVQNSAAGSTFDFTNNIVTNLLANSIADTLDMFKMDDVIVDVRKNNANFNIELNENNVWTTDENYINADPQYLDAANAVLTVQNDAFYTMGTDGALIGDPRWNKNLASTDAFLSDLTIDGTTVTGFSIGIFNYEVLLAPGTTTAGTVAAVARDTQNAVVVITQAGALPSAATVVITAEDGTTVRTYTINFIVADGALDATQLSDLTVNGTTVAGFDKEVFTYDVVLDPGTTTVPTVVGTPVDNAATVTLTDATELPGTSTVMVSNTYTNPGPNTYTINFTVAISTDATLSAITIDGEPLTLQSGITFYNVGITGTTIPTVTATPTYAGATVVITDATTFPGETKIVVTAEDGVTVITYTLKFDVALSSDASLSDLKVDGTSISGFSASIFSYDIELSTFEVPGILATTTDVNATASVSYPNSIPGTATVTVTAEDGTTQAYAINFTTTAVELALSPIAKLGLYPNPVVNMLSIHNALEVAELSVYSTAGSLVKRFKNDNGAKSIDLDVSDLDKGVYFINLLMIDQTELRTKIIK